MKALFNADLLSGKLKFDEPMSKHTSWKIGGLADYYYSAKGIDDLILFLKQVPATMSITCIGNGSNLLVRDGGIRGVVISMAAFMDAIEVMEDCRINVGAGVPCPKVARFAASGGLTGSEFLAGIPGTMGGALAMNAGAYGGEIWDIVESVTVLDRRGEPELRSKRDFEVAYRKVSLKQDEWFISCCLRLQQSDKTLCNQKIRTLLSERNEQQPVGQLSCGSVFRNPKDDYAARLIDACGLKGTRIGRACVSRKHANFIVNMGNASSLDVESLIILMHDAVKRRCGVDLQAEVNIIGDLEEDAHACKL